MLGTAGGGLTGPLPIRAAHETINGSTTSFAYGGRNFIQEKNASGTPVANLLTAGLDGFFARTDPAGSRYPLTDALGSTVGLPDSAGVVQTS